MEVLRTYITKGARRRTHWAAAVRGSENGLASPTLEACVGGSRCQRTRPWPEFARVKSRCAAVAEGNDPRTTGQVSETPLSRASLGITVRIGGPAQQSACRCAVGGHLADQPNRAVNCSVIRVRPPSCPDRGSPIDFLLNGNSCEAELFSSSTEYGLLRTKLLASVPHVASVACIVRTYIESARHLADARGW